MARGPNGAIWSARQSKRKQLPPRDNYKSQTDCKLAPERKLRGFFVRRYYGVRSHHFSGQFVFGDSIVTSLVFQSSDLRIDIVALLLEAREFVVPIVGPRAAILPG